MLHVLDFCADWMLSIHMALYVVWAGQLLPADRTFSLGSRGKIGLR
jgi:hypothetical protein